MSGHADTIRLAINAAGAEGHLVAGAWDSLDALLAENQRLREALEGLDVPLQWIAENYPATLQAMPSEAYLAIGQAREALAGDTE